MMRKVKAVLSGTLLVLSFIFTHTGVSAHAQTGVTGTTPPEHNISVEIQLGASGGQVTPPPPVIPGPPSIPGPSPSQPGAPTPPSGPSAGPTGPSLPQTGATVGHTFLLGGLFLMSSFVIILLVKLAKDEQEEAQAVVA